MKTAIESIVIRDRKDNLGRYFCKNNVTIGATANPKHNQMYNNLFWVQAVRQEGGHRNEISNVYRHCKYGKWSMKKIDHHGVPFFWFDATKSDARNETLFRISWESRKGKWEIV